MAVVAAELPGVVAGDLCHGVGKLDASVILRCRQEVPGAVHAYECTYIGEHRIRNTRSDLASKLEVAGH